MEASNSLLCVNKHYEQYTSKLLAISKPLSPKQTKTYTHAYFHCIYKTFHFMNNIEKFTRKITQTQCKKWGYIIV